MTIAYHVGKNLYLNITNRCTARCDFCLRGRVSGVGDAEDLWLEYEPDIEEILKSAAQVDWRNAPEIVFCGFGEPTMRLDVMLEAAREFKKQKPAIKLRLNTNGHGSMIEGRDITPELSVFDVVSVSLNYPDSESYNEHCPTIFGDKAYDSVLEFIRSAVKYVPNVTASVLSFLSDDDIERARKIAENLGADFRVREESR
ncbi:MAG: TatD family nuclease-associated radical SAM protein [Oscillospiraceae bacterium]|nr:TatD family nuclease-associated radical SAM protein [Oscillospiraceae bacterium]